MRKGCRVSVVEPVGGHGGMDYYDYGLCGGLADSGVDTVLFTCDETSKRTGLPFSVRYTYIGIYNNSPAWLRGLWFIVGSLRSIAASVWERRKIMHFHFFNAGPLEFMNVLLARMAARRVVITAHDVEPFFAAIEVPYLSRLSYRMAHYVIAHNKVSQQELINRIGLPKERIAVIPHGNYLHAIRSMPEQDDARKALKIPKGARVILFFGQIKDVKGLDLLLEAMPAVLKAHPEALLLIAGRPWKSDFSIYVAQIERLGIVDQCINHIRYIPDEEVALYYSAADVVALPYRRIYQSGVVLMAMSHAKVVLVSNLPGMKEIVHHQKNGFIFDLNKDGDLSDKLCMILNDDALRKRVSECGYEYVRMHHDWQHIGTQTARLYSRIVLMRGENE